MDGVLLQVDIIFGREMIRKKLQGGCGELIDTLLKAFVTFAVFKWWSVLN